MSTIPLQERRARLAVDSDCVASSESQGVLIQYKPLHTSCPDRHARSVGEGGIVDVIAAAAGGPGAADWEALMGTNLQESS